MFSYVWWNASQNHRSSRAERASTIRAARVCFVCCASRSSLALASSGMRTSALMTKVYNMVNRDVYTVDGRGSVHSLGSPGRELLRVEVEAEQGVLDDLAERRVDPVLPTRHLSHGLPEGHPLDQRLDQVRRLRTHEVRAEQFARGWVRDHFADTCGVLHRPAVCRVAVRLRLRDVLAALGLELLLGQSDAGDLRRGEDRLGDCLLYTSPSPRDG